MQCDEFSKMEFSYETCAFTSYKIDWYRLFSAAQNLRNTLERGFPDSSSHSKCKMCMDFSKNLHANEACASEPGLNEDRGHAKRG